MEHLGEALARAQHQWQARFRAAAMERREDGGLVPAAVTIAIAREEGADGTAIGQRVAERLGWQVYDHELLHRIATPSAYGDSGGPRELLARLRQAMSGHRPASEQGASSAEQTAKGRPFVA